MNILSVKCDNVFMFKNFSLDFTYSKKNSHPLCENDELFRGSRIHVRKNVIVLGANASGKSTFGRLLKLIFRGAAGEFCTEFSELERVRFDKKKTATVEVEFSIERFAFRWFFRYDSKGIYDERIDTCPLLEKDSARTVRKVFDGELTRENAVRFSAVEGRFFGNFLQGLSLCGTVFHENNWIKYNIYEKGSRFFVAPFIESNGYKYKLEEVPIRWYNEFLGKVDASVKKVASLRATGKEEQADALRVEFFNRESVTLARGKNGDWVNADRLSSGTQEALCFFETMAEMVFKKDLCLYVDEQLAHLHTELEQYLLYKAMLLNKENQVFFTSHNSGLLDLNLSNGAFLFFRRDDKGFNTAFFADRVMNKNDRSLRNYYENDYFGVLPDYTSLDGFFRKEYRHGK